jgi:adenosine deaminase
MLGAGPGRALAGAVFVSSAIAAGYLVSRWRRGRNPSPQSSSIRNEDIGQPLIEAISFEPEEIERYIKSSPKAELHCHLNGSVRIETLKELLGDSAIPGDGVVHSIEDAFVMFKLVYKAVDTELWLRRIVRECLEDAVLDNVCYLELRTTPRKMSDVLSRREYVKIVTDEIGKFPLINNQRPLTSFPTGKVAVRLILTIDRSQPVSVAEQTVDIALKFPDWVVGVDFAGNPTVGQFQEFRSVFERARGHGLFTTVHTSEIRGVEEETSSILDFKPNRMGHFLFPTDSQIEEAIRKGIFIESCPTSNMCAISGKSPVDGDMNGHSMLDFFVRNRSNLFSINTDDPGVFSVRLSDEVFSVARTFKLNTVRVREILTAAASHAFLPRAERDVLVSTILNA